MLKKILIIGNGFDLAHGLPTKYADFLTFSYEFMKLYHDDVKVELHNSSLNGYLGDEIRTLSQQSQSKRNESPMFNNILEKLHDDLSDNIWFQYFLLLFKDNLLKGQNWIDFESEMSYVIQQIDKNTDDINETYSNLEERFAKSHVDKMINLDKAVDYSLKHNTRREYSVLQFSEELFKDLERLTEALEIYLAYVVEGHIIGKVSKLIPKIQELSPDYVVSFNYTHTFQRIYDKYQKAKYCYIHGECRSFDKDSCNFEKPECNLVLGIDEYLGPGDRDNNNKFVIFKKFVQRIRNHNDTSYRSWVMTFSETYNKGVTLQQRLPNKDSVINDPYYVYAYGHSLDITDKDILRLFMWPEWANVNIFTKDKMSEGRLIENLIKIIGEDVVIDKASQNPPKLVLSEIK